MPDIPKGTYVKVTNPESDLHGKTGFVYRSSGDERPPDDDGVDVVPEGWVELTFDPVDMGGFHGELFKVDDVSIEAC